MAKKRTKKMLKNRDRALKALAKIETLCPTAPWSRSGTSQAAADSLEGFLSPRRFFVWMWILENGPIADHEMTEQMGCGDTRLVSPRRIELERAGLVHDAGEDCKTPAGHDAKRWIITPDFDPAKVVQYVEAKKNKTQRIFVGEFKSIKDAVHCRLPMGRKYRDLYIAPKIFARLVKRLGELDAGDDEALEQLFEYLWLWHLDNGGIP